eukprot:6712477-Prymnesium_polylepis.1
MTKSLTWITSLSRNKITRIRVLTKLEDNRCEDNPNVGSCLLLTCRHQAATRPPCVQRHVLFFSRACHGGGRGRPGRAA